MAANDNVADLTAKAYEITRRIPYGKVTTYGTAHERLPELKGGVDHLGHIARLAGYPTYPRHVGNAMKMLNPGTDIPWHRVISAKGIISPRGDAGLGVERQRQRLEAEGVVVETLVGQGGEKVDIREYGWFPEEIPGFTIARD